MLRENFETERFIWIISIESFDFLSKQDFCLRKYYKRYNYYRALGVFASLIISWILEK